MAHVCWPLLLLLFLGASGCSARYALQYVLSPLGYAWYGDLERIRSVHGAQLTPSQMQKLAKDRWRRALKSTLRVLRKRKSKLPWPTRLMAFSRRLTTLTRRAKEPYARWVLAEYFQRRGAKAQMAAPLLLSYVGADPDLRVRKKALQALIELKPPGQIVLRATTLGLRDPHYAARAGVLLLLIPDAAVPGRSLHSFVPAILKQCLGPIHSLPRPMRLRGKLHTGQALQLRLQRNCLSLIPYLVPAQRKALMPLLEALSAAPGPLQLRAKAIRQRVLYPPKEP